MSNLTSHSRIYIAGHCGLVGASLLRHLICNGFDNTLVRTKNELDLTSRKDVWNFFNDERPEYVILAAAKVGGIAANMAEPVNFLVDKTIWSILENFSSCLFDIYLLFLSS